MVEVTKISIVDVKKLENGKNKIVDSTKNPARELLSDYFASSTIHGIKYIGTRPLAEK